MNSIASSSTFSFPVAVNSPSKSASLLMASLNLFGLDRIYLGQYLLGTIKGAAILVFFGFAFEYFLLNEKSILFRRKEVGGGVKYFAIFVAVGYAVDLLLAIWNTVTFSRSTPETYGVKRVWSEGSDQRFCVLLLGFLISFLIVVIALLASHFRPNDLFEKIKKLSINASTQGLISNEDIAGNTLATNPEFRKEMEDLLRNKLRAEIEEQLRVDYNKDMDALQRNIDELRQLYAELQATCSFPLPTNPFPDSSSSSITEELEITSKPWD